MIMHLQPLRRERANRDANHKQGHDQRQVNLQRQRLQQQIHGNRRQRTGRARGNRRQPAAKAEREKIHRVQQLAWRYLLSHARLPRNAGSHWRLAGSALRLRAGSEFPALPRSCQWPGSHRTGQQGAAPRPCSAAPAR